MPSYFSSKEKLLTQRSPNLRGPRLITLMVSLKWLQIPQYLFLIRVKFLNFRDGSKQAQRRKGTFTAGVNKVENKKKENGGRLGIFPPSIWRQNAWFYVSMPFTETQELTLARACHSLRRLSEPCQISTKERGPKAF